MISTNPGEVLLTKSVQLCYNESKKKGGGIVQKIELEQMNREMTASSDAMAQADAAWLQTIEQAASSIRRNAQQAEAYFAAQEKK